MARESTTMVDAFAFPSAPDAHSRLDVRSKPSAEDGGATPDDSYAADYVAVPPAAMALGLPGGGRMHAWIRARSVKELPGKRHLRYVAKGIGPR